jgi:putative GTP pyrophosphokinase
MYYIQTERGVKLRYVSSPMVSEISRTQIDRLGDRLRKGNISDDDLRLLDLYRRSFSEAYEIVVGKIREELVLEPTGRPAKSTTSISDKLRRESIRLTQIQDIAGCRLIVMGIVNQESVVQSLKNLFEDITIVDRRERPSHGYRAVHAIVSCLGKTVEIQVRTSLQHQWAELSEKLADVKNPAIKYGGGSEKIQAPLQQLSSLIAQHETLESAVDKLMRTISRSDKTANDKKRLVTNAHEKVDETRRQILDTIRDLIQDIR